MNVEWVACEARVGIKHSSTNRPQHSLIHFLGHASSYGGRRLGERKELRKQEFERRNAGGKGSVQTYTLIYPTSFCPIGQHSDLSHHSLTYPYYILTYPTALGPMRQHSVLSPLHSDLSHCILTYIHYILTFPTTF